ncbi:T9SS type A sorting domain-containing protein [Lewinella sp. LCG006]|uniref:T9SS type A sorting domain-containing protein n=1 Tax=Lewinella sp. LCG006 TaxID=3231911 RepID=UPI0034614D63
MLRIVLNLLFISVFSLSIAAQTGCPGCLIDLPTLPEDTIFLSAAPEGQAGIYYDGDLSFRLPKTTTPVNATDPTIPAGLDISQFTILAVAGLPAGMNWEASQTNFVTEEGTDGCVKLCGTPLLPGLYMVEVVIEAVVLIFPQQTSFSFPLLINPAQTITEGFTVVNNNGCGSVTASFINNVPSGGAEGFSYLWFFNNGNSTTAENPADQTYNQPGEYLVNYQAIVDTTGFFMTQVRIEQSPCTDLFSASDLKFDLFDPNGDHVYTAPIVGNATLPVIYNVLIPIGEGTYELHVIDDDGGLDGADDLCGIIEFGQGVSGLLQDGDLQVNIELVHPVDTIRSSEIITVYEIPNNPLITIAEASPYCDGEVVTLVSANYDNSLTWYADSVLVVGASTDTLLVVQDGNYWATYTTEEGCAATSQPIAINFTDNPADIDLLQNGNLLRLEDESNLPTDFSFTWLYEGEPIPSATALLLCAEAAGTYTLVITDNVTGCSTSADIAASYDPNLDCTTPTEEVLGQGSWKLFPNPLQSYLFVEGPINLAVEIRVFDALGRAVINQQLTNGNDRIDVQQLSAGAYFYQLISTPGEIIQTGTLMKVN